MSGRKILAEKAAKCTHNAGVIGNPASTKQMAGIGTRETGNRRA